MERKKKKLRTITINYLHYKCFINTRSVFNKSQLILIDGATLLLGSVSTFEILIVTNNSATFVVLCICKGVFTNNSKFNNSIA